MKSEYFILLPNDFRCSSQRFRSHRVKNENVITENLSQLNAPVLMTEPPSRTMYIFLRVSEESSFD